ncbi:hypothetical protein KKB55_04060 [Myxococcota bacterium]|nr:hypothetical protein [Myxococcota bacterium]MBU1896925.1 hypothetical protein [Myxococcota bacterium]
MSYELKRDKFKVSQPSFNVREDDTIDDLYAYLKNIENIISKSASLEDGLVYCKGYLHWALKIINNSEVSVQFIDHIFHYITEGEISIWYRMLDPDDQFFYWTMVDYLFMRKTLLKTIDVDLFLEIRSFIKNQTVHSTDTASMLLSEMLPFDNVSNAVDFLDLIDLIKKYGDTPEKIYICSLLELDSNVHLARKLASTSGDEHQQILNLIEFDQNLTNQFNEYAIKKISFLNIKYQNIASEFRTKKSNELISLTDGWSIKPYPKLFKFYLEGRIHGITSSPKKAVKLFKKALNGGFCEELAVTQLLFTLNFLKRHQEVRRISENYARCWKLKQSDCIHDAKSDGFSLPKAYLMAGGNPMHLGLEDPLSDLKHDAEINAARAERAAEKRLRKIQGEARRAYWDECRSRSIALISGALRAEDFDNLVKGRAPTRQIKLDPDTARRLNLLDSANRLPFEHTTLTAAVEEGVEATRLAAEFLEFILSSSERFEGLVENIRRYHAHFGASTQLARRRVETLLADGEREQALKLIDVYRRLPQPHPPEALERLALLVLAQLGADGARAELIEVAEGFLEHGPSEAIRALLLEHIAAAITESCSPKQLRGYLRILTAHGSPETTQGLVSAWWSKWLEGHPKALEHQVQIVEWMLEHHVDLPQAREIAARAAIELFASGEDALFIKALSLVEEHARLEVEIIDAYQRRLKEIEDHQARLDFTLFIVEPLRDEAIKGHIGEALRAQLAQVPVSFWRDLSRERLALLRLEEALSSEGLFGARRVSIEALRRYKIAALLALILLLIGVAYLWLGAAQRATAEGEAPQPERVQHPGASPPPSASATVAPTLRPTKVVEPQSAAVEARRSTGVVEPQAAAARRSERRARIEAEMRNNEERRRLIHEAIAQFEEMYRYYNRKNRGKYYQYLPEIMDCWFDETNKKKSDLMKFYDKYHFKNKVYRNTEIKNIKGSIASDGFSVRLAYDMNTYKKSKKGTQTFNSKQRLALMRKNESDQWHLVAFSDPNKTESCYH